MTRRIRLLVAGLGLATAAVTAPALTTSTPPDTTWGAPDTTADTTWGNPSTGGGGDGSGEDTPVHPTDTTWG